MSIESDKRADWINSIRISTAEYNTKLIEDLSEDEIENILMKLFIDLEDLMEYVFYFECMATPSKELESYYSLLQRPKDSKKRHEEFAKFTPDEVVFLLGSLALARHEVVEKLQQFKNKLMLKKSGISVAP